MISPLRRRAAAALRARFPRREDPKEAEEREATARAFERPTGADRARAEAELGRAAGMSEEDLAEATRLIERDFVAKLIGVLSRLSPDVAMRLLTAYFALTDARVPFAAKAGMAAILLYFLSPFDVVPDALPLVGFLDDVGLLSVAWGYLRRNVRSEHVAEAEAFIRDVLAEA